ncbi:hypothetical protein [Mycolicibacterium sp.]|uniref:hypothetical protein n=1 Tax=Mycolicibacterium sp. TaxID=2320850 RepID=UPI00355D8E87
MPEITQTVNVLAWFIGAASDGFGDWADLVTWCQDTEGMSCTMSARLDGTLRIQVEGVNHATVYPSPGQWVTFNTFAFEVLDADEFAEKYGTA